MKIEIRNRCSDFTSYRAARVKSLFNVEAGCSFDLDADLPIDDAEWKVGLIVGPSGSGKTSMGRRVLGPKALYEPLGWPAGANKLRSAASLARASSSCGSGFGGHFRAVQGFRYLGEAAS